MRRRTLLAALPASALLVGCNGQPGSPNPTESTDPTGSPEPRDPNGTDQSPSEQDGTPTDDGPSTPLAWTLRASFRRTVNVDGVDVVTPTNAQFLFVEVPDIGGSPSRREFSLHLGEDRYDPRIIDPRYGAWTPGVDALYTSGTDPKPGRDIAEDDVAMLAFDLPTLEVESGALIFNGTEYPLEEDDFEDLARLPDLVLESVTVPDAVPQSENVELGVTVRNDGDIEGLFLAGFRYSGFPLAIDLSVPPGETRSESVSYETYEEGVMTFDFDYPGGDRSYEVEIEGGTATP